MKLSIVNIGLLFASACSTVYASDHGLWARSTSSDSVVAAVKKIRAALANFDAEWVNLVQSNDFNFTRNAIYGASLADAVSQAQSTVAAVTTVFDDVEVDLIHSQLTSLVVDVTVLATNILSKRPQISSATTNLFVTATRDAISQSALLITFYNSLGAKVPASRTLTLGADRLKIGSAYSSVTRTLSPGFATPVKSHSPEINAVVAGVGKIKSAFAKVHDAIESAQPSSNFTGQNIVAIFSSLSVLSRVLSSENSSLAGYTSFVSSEATYLTSVFSTYDSSLSRIATDVISKRTVFSPEYKNIIGTFFVTQSRIYNSYVGTLSRYAPTSPVRAFANPSSTASLFYGSITQSYLQ